MYVRKIVRIILDMKLLRSRCKYDVTSVWEPFLRSCDGVYLWMCESAVDERLIESLKGCLLTTIAYEFFLGVLG